MIAGNNYDYLVLVTALNFASMILYKKILILWRKFTMRTISDHNLNKNAQVDDRI